MPVHVVRLARRSWDPYALPESLTLGLFRPWRVEPKTGQLLLAALVQSSRTIARCITRGGSQLGLASSGCRLTQLSSTCPYHLQWYGHRRCSVRCSWYGHEGSCVRSCHRPGYDIIPVRVDTRAPHHAPPCSLEDPPYCPFITRQSMVLVCCLGHGGHCCTFQPGAGDHQGWVSNGAAWLSQRMLLLGEAPLVLKAVSSFTISSPLRFIHMLSTYSVIESSMSYHLSLVFPWNLAITESQMLESSLATMHSAMARFG